MCKLLDTLPYHYSIDEVWNMSFFSSNNHRRLRETWNLSILIYYALWTVSYSNWYGMANEVNCECPNYCSDLHRASDKPTSTRKKQPEDKNKRSTLAIDGLPRLMSVLIAQVMHHLPVLIHKLWFPHERHDDRLEQALDIPLAAKECIFWTWIELRWDQPRRKLPVECFCCQYQPITAIPISSLNWVDSLILNMT